MLLILIGGFKMDKYLVFASIVFLISIYPGPNILLTINNALKYNLKRAIFGVLGISSALIVFSIVSVLSLGGLFVVSDTIFTAMKIIGALYLFYLGIKLLLYSNKKINDEFQGKKLNSRTSIYLESFLCCATNPNVLFVYLSIIPQFIITSKSNVFNQLVVMASIQFTSGVVSALFYLFVANKFAYKIKSGMRPFSIISGAVFCVFGITLLVTNNN